MIKTKSVCHYSEYICSFMNKNSLKQSSFFFWSAVSSFQASLNDNFICKVREKNMHIFYNINIKANWVLGKKVSRTR